MSMPKLAATGDLDTIVIRLSRLPDQPATVASVDVLNAEMLTKHEYRQSRMVGEVFCDQFAAALDGAISMATKEKTSLPEFEVAIPGLILAGLRVVTHHEKDGAERITLRFRQYLGSIQSAFKTNPDTPMPVAAIREKIAVDVLHDIVTPLFDILSIAQNAPAKLIDANCDTLRNRLDRLAVRQEEITFFTGLLQRYVAGCRYDADAGLETRDPIDAALTSQNKKNLQFS